MQYLIEDDNHALRISKDRHGYDLLWIETNGRTLAFDATMATHVMHGLMALLKGDFTEATTTLSLRLAAERVRVPVDPTDSIASLTKPSLKPSLGDL